MGKKFCALGIKKDITNPITNIIGTVSENREPNSIIEDGHLYKMIIDKNGNGDINNGSGGYYLYLYYTTENLHLPPIRDIIVGSYRQKKTSFQEVVNNSKKSLRNGELDCCSGTWGSNYNYIFIIRD